jgi:hypothetical protein
MRVLVWLVALYLIADFSDPGLPGAFNFNPDDSVEVVHIDRTCADSLVAPATARPFGTPNETGVVVSTVEVPQRPTVSPAHVRPAAQGLFRPHLQTSSPEDDSAPSPIA